MNKSSLAIVAALTTVATLPALAVVDSPRGSAQRIEVSAPHAALLAAQAAQAARLVLAQRNVDMGYAMASGRPMTVTADVDAIEVRYGRRTAFSARHDGKGNFVSADGRFALQFSLDGHGKPQLVQLSLPAALR